MSNWFAIACFFDFLQILSVNDFSQRWNSINHLTLLISEITFSNKTATYIYKVNGSWISEPKKIDSRIKVIHKKNGGLSDARNYGLEIMSGEYVSFIDSDDYIESDMYSKLYDALISNDSSISMCAVNKVWENGKKCKMGKFLNKIYNSEEAFKALIEEEISQVVWNKLYKAKLVKNILFDVGKYHEDEFWSYKVISKAKKICSIDYIGYNYFQRMDSIMGKEYSKKRLDAIEAKAIRQNYIKEYFPNLIKHGNINLYFSCLYQGQLILKARQICERKEMMIYLKSIVKKISFSNFLFNNSKLGYILWFIFGKISFVGTCKLRNKLNIGL